MGVAEIQAGNSRASLQHASEFPSGERRRQRLSCFFKRFDRFFNEFAKLSEHLLGIVAMAAAVHQLGAATD
jgi:hypothetical protein